jgi:hypothetical protein
LISNDNTDMNSSPSIGKFSTLEEKQVALEAVLGSEGLERWSDPNNVFGRFATISQRRHTFCDCSEWNMLMPVQSVLFAVGGAKLRSSMNLTNVIPQLRGEFRDIEAAILSVERLQQRSRRRGMPRMLVGRTSATIVEATQ